MREILILASLIFIFSSDLAYSMETSHKMGVIVHPAVQEDGVSMDQLREIWLGKKQFWTGGQRISLLLPPTGSPELKLLLSTICKMEEAQYRRYWMLELFRARVPTLPQSATSHEMGLDLTRRIPGAISFAHVNPSDKSYKILRIDGILPQENGYPLP